MKVELKIWASLDWQDGMRATLRREAKAKGWDLALTFCPTVEWPGPGFEIIEPDVGRESPEVWEIRQIVTRAFAQEASLVRGREVHARSW